VPNENEEILQLNAAQYLATLNKMQAGHVRLQDILKTSVENLNRFYVGQTKIEGTFSTTDKAGNKLTATLRRQAGEWKVVAGSMELVADGLKKHIDLIEKYDPRRFNRQKENIARTAGLEGIITGGAQRGRATRAGEAVTRDPGVATTGGVGRQIDDSLKAKQAANDAAFIAGQKARARAAEEAGARLARAFSAVAQADTAAAKTVLNVNKQILAQGERDARQRENALRRAQKELERAKLTNEKVTNAINLSWQTLARVFVIHSFHRAISAFIQQLTQAVDQAALFQIKISEIRTISQDSQQSFTSWSESIRVLSDQFGSPINDVAAGVYEVISNQIAKGAEATRFMAEAMTFAQITASSTQDSVNLLSSAINSYGLAASDAGKVSAILFKVIDLGRVTASEMADTFGRVAQLSASTGITLEELGAALATLTINGVRYSEAFTLINNITLKLIKPTEDMQKLFRQWGVSSGEAAIATFGFAGVLGKLEEATHGSATELAELFRDIRAIRGATGLTEALEGYNRNLEEIRNSANETSVAVGIATESAGRAFIIEMNKIKNFFIKDFGARFLEVLKSLGITGSESSFSLVSGIKLVATAGTGLLASYLLITPALKIFTFYQAVSANTALLQAAGYTNVTRAGVAMHLMTTNNTSALGRFLSFAQSGAGIVTGLVTVGVALFLHQRQKIQELSTFAATRQAEDEIALAKLTEATKKEIDARTSLTQRGIETQFQTHLQHATKVRRLQTELGDHQTRKFNEATQRFQASLDIQKSAYQKHLNDLKKSAEQAIENAQTAREKITDIRQGLGKRQFDLRLSLLPDAEQIKALQQKAGEVAAESQKKLFLDVGDPIKSERNLKNALELFEESDRIQTELLQRRAGAEEKVKTLAQQIAETEGKISDRQNLRTAQEAKRLATEARRASTAKERNAAEEELIRLEQSAGGDVREAQQEGQDRASAVRLGRLQAELEAQKEILDILPQRQEFEQTFADLADRQTKALEEYAGHQERLSKIQEDRLKQEQIQFQKLEEIFKKLGAFKVPDEIKTIEEGQTLSKSFGELVDRATSEGGLKDQAALLELRKQQGEVEEQIRQKLKDRAVLEQQERLTNLKEESIKLNNQLAEQEKKLVDERTGAEQGIIRNAEELKKVLFTLPITRGVENAANALQAAADAFAKGPTKETAQALQSAIEEAETQRSKLNVGGRSRVDTSQVEIGRDRTLQNLLTEFQGNINKLLFVLPEGEKQLVTDKEALGALEKVIGVPLSAGTQIGVLGETAKTTSERAKELGTEFQNLQIGIKNTEAAIRAAFAQQGIVPQTKAHGGSIQARGTDIVPALLTPGEFVVRKSATEKYLPVLRAINAMRFDVGGVANPLRHLHISEGYGDVPNFRSQSRAIETGFPRTPSMLIDGDVIIQGVPITGTPVVDADLIQKALDRRFRRHNG
jgi:TP901 family phage tail tape measure protein